MMRRTGARTDAPVTFGELKTYEEQLQSRLEPAPSMFLLNLPPDLYLPRSNGIDMIRELPLYLAADQRL